MGDDDALIFESDRFDFEVSRGLDYSSSDLPFSGLVSVSLPHQRDAWNITGEPFTEFCEVEPSAALADLTAFIAEAEQARAALIDFIAGGVG